MEAASKIVKVRSPNFTDQECMLLAQLMGESFGEMGLSRHKVDKHKFNERITSATKRMVWDEVARLFNAQAQNGLRKAGDLSKKWENLVAKHRAIYSDYAREMKRTGSAPTPTKYSVITEAVIDVIGKDSVSVLGVGDYSTDTTRIQLEDKTKSGIPSEKGLNAPRINDTLKRTKSEACCHCQCHCSDQELLQLKKKKLQLEILKLENDIAKRDIEQ